ncbi:Hypp8836 [Branchiostoma lanceolatum]|uniref:Hypp8836 protein n=1 Tax=Branchiostoma lanceolatum TaxID=7740 RepID=A0A8J9Z9E4_BRALA|nr:Hypp8836 [Branchiostoma lanceolatum]
MDCAKRTQHHAPDDSSPTPSQTEGGSMGAVGLEQNLSEWLTLAYLGNRIVAAPLSSEIPGDEWERRYSVQDGHGKTVLLYRTHIFRPDQLTPDHHFITGEDIDKSTRKEVEEVLHSMFQEKNSNVHVDTAFEYCKQYCTKDKESANVITSSEFNEHMESIIVLIEEDGKLNPRRISKSKLTPGGVRIDEDQRRPVAAIINTFLKGIPDNNLDPLPIVHDEIDRRQTRMFNDRPSNGECPGSSEDSEGSSSDEEAPNRTEGAHVSALGVVGTELVPALAAADAQSIPVPALDEQSVCGAAVRPLFSAEIMGISLTTVFRHMRTSCDRSNLLCWICLHVMGMFMHVFGCRYALCAQKQLISQVPGTVAMPPEQRSLTSQSHALPSEDGSLQSTGSVDGTASLLPRDTRSEDVSPSMNPVVKDGLEALGAVGGRSESFNPRLLPSAEANSDAENSSGLNTELGHHRGNSTGTVRFPSDEEETEDDKDISDIEEKARTAMVHVSSDKLIFPVQESAHESDGLEAFGAVGGRSGSFSLLPSSDAENSSGDEAYERKVRVAIRDSVARSKSL